MYILNNLCASVRCSILAWREVIGGGLSRFLTSHLGLGRLGSNEG